MTKQVVSTQDHVVTVDRDAFRGLFEEQYDYVFHSLRRLGVDARDLEDLAHDVFVEVYKSFARYDPSRPIKPWLFAFAFRFASTYRRLARHRTDLGADDETGVSAATAEDRVARSEGARIVGEALATMSIELRGVFVLHEIDETPMKEIAQSLGIPLNTAYSRLRLARAAFESAVKIYRVQDDPSGKGES